MKNSRQLTPAEKAVDLGKWLLSHGTVILQTGSEWLCECPKCRKPKLAVNVQKKAWQCWTCEFAGWRPAVLAAAILDCHLDEAEDNFAATRDFRDIAELTVHKPARRRRLLPVAPAPPGTIWQLDGRAERYAAKRGISPENARLFGLSSIRGDGSGSKADKMLTGRLLVPVWINSRFVYWIARATIPSKVKVLNLPAPEHHAEWGLDHTPSCATRNEVLVGLHLVQPGEAVVLVEGPLDAAVCGPGYVATMGSRLSQEQAFLLAGAGVGSVTVLFDGDEAGRHGAAKAARLLSSFLPAKVAWCPDGADPASMGRDSADALIGNAHSPQEIGPLVL